MKQWLQTLLQMTTWTANYPSAPELARELKRDPGNVYRDLRMMEGHGFVRRVLPRDKNPDADFWYDREYGGAKGLQFRWRITKRGLKRLGWRI